MVNPTSMQYYSSELDSQDPKVLSLMFQTGARGAAITRLPQGDSGKLLFQAAGATQDQIDDFLDTEDEFLAATLDAAGIGFGVQGGAVLIKTGGQVKKVLGFKVTGCALAGGSLGEVVAGGEGDMEAGQQMKIEKGYYGNLCLKFDAMNVTGASDYNSCILIVDVMYIPE